MRIANWEAALAAHFAKAAATAFQWGVFDCALAVCDGVNAITGIDPGGQVRGRYASEREALKVLGGASLGDFAAGICAAQNWPEAPRATFGRRGDVALVNNGNPANALGTIDLSGRFAWCAAGDKGFIRVPMESWLRAWKIG